MSAFTAVILCLFALAGGGLIGWLVGGRGAGALKAERDLHLENFKAAIRDLETAIEERDSARIDAVKLRAEHDAFEARLAELREAKDALSAQFAEVGNRLLSEAQRQFLERADQRFKQSEESSGQVLKSLLQPVNERLQRYEETVAKVEKDRSEAYGNLQGLMESMRIGQESVRAEAAKLGNSLRNAPKARGRWGEQQLRNVLETCGLSEHADFQTEVSVESGEGRLRPDVIIRVPGGRNLVIDAKVSLNAYQDAFEAGEDVHRQAALAAHAAAMKAHVNTLGQKAYQDQFEDTPDYVIMFVPGEHFLSAALEQDADLWDFAFAKRVLLATPTNLIAIARTVSAVWKQEKMAGQAREIAELGKELYARLSTMGGHVGRMGKNLDTAVSAYNALVGSLESQVLTQAKRFEELNIDTGGKAIEALPIVEQTTRPLVKLVSGGEQT
ncbi:DNA recombination protein RmuC [Aquisediminimonas profunda]|uniref:DNA recombination protein RmuC n=1 Tax=Aquisediminimonas profunda TaxID=1550733 RepID=UPI001C62E9FF|nr:DNA recombination protein RmuC [Aquisediminimonas profunda]